MIGVLVETSNISQGLGRVTKPIQIPNAGKLFLLGGGCKITAGSLRTRVHPYKKEWKINFFSQREHLKYSLSQNIVKAGSLNIIKAIMNRF